MANALLWKCSVYIGPPGQKTTERNYFERICSGRLRLNAESETFGAHELQIFGAQLKFGGQLNLIRRDGAREQISSRVPINSFVYWVRRLMQIPVKTFLCK